MLKYVQQCKYLRTNSNYNTNLILIISISLSNRENVKIISDKKICYSPIRLPPYTLRSIYLIHLHRRRFPPPPYHTRSLQFRLKNQCNIFKIWFVEGNGIQTATSKQNKNKNYIHIKLDKRFRCDL